MGSNKISFGNHFYANTGLTILDENYVTFGNNVVIGSGSVVTKNIPSGVIVAGNPCKVMREITDKDKEYWRAQYLDYINDVGDKYEV